MSQNPNTEDTIDLKELFFSLIAQWKLIALCTILSLVCALLYLRTTPNIYQVDAMVQVEDNKGASAALLGDLSEKMVQKSPAEAEIEILKSRLILGNVIHHLNLDLQVSSAEDSLIQRLIHKTEYQTKYSTRSVLFKDGNRSFSIRQFDIPSYYLDKNLQLNFESGNFTLTDTITHEPVFKGVLNRSNQFNSKYGLWKVAIYSRDQLTNTYNIKKLSLPAAVNYISAPFSVAEKGKQSGILGLNYEGTNKQHITQVLNAILAAYSQQNIERRTAETAQTLKFLDEQLPQTAT